MIVDVGVYDRGIRRPGSPKLAEAAADGAAEGCFAWVGLADPSQSELDEVAKLWDLHPLAVEDALHAHQRPKLDRYGDAIFVVLKTARYVDRDEVFEFGEVMLFVDESAVVTVRHGTGCDLPQIRRLLESEPERLAIGPSEVLLAIADHIVDGYETTVAAVEDDIDEIQVEVFSGPSSRHAERIFKLKREVLEFRQAVIPLGDATSAMAERTCRRSPTTAGPTSPTSTTTSCAPARGSRRSTPCSTGRSTPTSPRSACARTRTCARSPPGWPSCRCPTMIAGIYGMNFEHMPELGSVFGYPTALAVIVVACLVLYRNFKRRDWL